MSCEAPISWLLLERFALGELEPGERDRVKAHLTECGECRACLASLEADDASRELPALDAPRVRAAAVPRASRVTRLPVAPIAAALALAAGLVLWMRARPSERFDGVRVKGDAVALWLVANDDVAVEAGVYRDGEVLKAVVTCPPALSGAWWDLVVIDAQGASFPVAPARLTCGNANALPGAFRLVGHAPLEVCVVWDETGPVDRGRLVAERRPPRERAACVALRPSP